jgi:phosphate transport system protein
MATSNDPKGGTSPSSGPPFQFPHRNALRDQETLWAEFLAMARTVVDSLAKTIDVLCDGRLEVAREVKNVEKESDREEVRIEQECLRILALYEPVASDLRRLATILKVNRDWERIADLAARIARRSCKLASKSGGVSVPEPLKTLARDVLGQVRAAYEALAGRDAGHARGGRLLAAPLAARTAVE